MRYILHYFKWIMLGMIVTTGWNIFLIQRDKEMFQAYDEKCEKIQYSDPNCKYAK